MIPTIRPSVQPGAKRSTNRLSVRDDIRFSVVGLHLPIFKGARGRCEWTRQQPTEERNQGPSQSVKNVKCFRVSERRETVSLVRPVRTCFVEFHDERYSQVEEASLEAVYSSVEESDDQVSVHEPTNEIYPLLHPLIPTNWKILISETV